MKPEMDRDNPDVKRVEREVEEDAHEQARSRRAEARQELKHVVEDLVPESLRPGKPERRKFTP